MSSEDSHSQTVGEGSLKIKSYEKGLKDLDMIRPKNMTHEKYDSSFQISEGLSHRKVDFRF